MLDYYFRRPLFWDYLLAMLVTVAAYFGLTANIITQPPKDQILSTASDLLTISLTIAGFVLTLLTILITFKSSSTVSSQTNQEEEPVFNVFFGTSYYFETVKHLKNGIKSLLFVSIAGYFIKLLISTHSQLLIYLFSIFGVVIIGLTLSRCLIILSKIIKLQDDRQRLD
jgi:tellurite resistance protein TehA-like permease